MNVVRSHYAIFLRLGSLIVEVLSAVNMTGMEGYWSIVTCVIKLVI